MKRHATLLYAAALTLCLRATAAEPALGIAVATDGLQRMTGERMRVTATFQTSAPVEKVFAFLTLVNLDETERTVVDLPDWGAEQTHILNQVTNGTQVSWTLTLAAPGTYALYTTAIAQDAGLRLAQSEVLPLHIAERSFVSLGVILPLSVGMPMSTLVLLWLLARRRARLFALD